VAKCRQPGEHDVDEFYRSPCLDTSTADPTDTLMLRFEEDRNVTFRISIANTGTVNLTGIRVTDSETNTNGWASSLAPGGSDDDDDSVRMDDVSGSDDSYEFSNIATVDSAQTLPSTDTATIIVERPPARLRIFKYVSSFREGSDGDGEPSFGTDRDITVTFNERIDEARVWYKVILVNTGGRTARDIDIDDSNGNLPYGRDNPTADCDSRPNSLRAGDVWECRYREDFDEDSPATTVNTVEVTGSNVDSDDPDNDLEARATVRVNRCQGSNQVVPNLIGLDKGEALDAWEDAGFERDNLDTWNGNNGSDVETQSRQAYSCIPDSSSMNVTRTETR
jgi:hypothetical protein